MSKLLSTKEVARYLSVNEKMVYTLVSEKGLPASKVTGKWLFPQHLVDQWIEANTINFPRTATRLPPYEGLLVIAGSNDPLLEQVISLFNATYPQHVAVFGNLGSMGGIRALKQNLCHIATSHLLQEEDDEYNFEEAAQMLGEPPVIVNFCRRHQGLLLETGNPKQLRSMSDLKKTEVRLVNRKLGTGTRQLFDHELKKAGLKGQHLKGYDYEVERHMDVGLAILSRRADAGPGIQPVADLLGLDFMPWRWERYDLLIPKVHFFDQAMQNFLGLLHEKQFAQMAQGTTGYDIAISGKMVFPQMPRETAQEA
ncbi:MAG: helix-turn-helix transcriptional regulator [Desulfosarcinaceae bacterium]